MQLGIDIVNITDFKKRTDNAGFIKWVYTQSEILQCTKKREPHKCFASKFAVKESMLKAIYDKTCKGLQLRNYEIQNDTNGKPYIVNHKEALVSVSYIDKCVIAIAIIK